MKKNKSKFNVKNATKEDIYEILVEEEIERFEKIKHDKNKKIKFKNNED